MRRFEYLQIRLRRRMACTAITRRFASVSGITYAASARASGITSSCGVSGSGRRRIVVQTGTVHRICDSDCSNTASSNSSIIVPDEEDIGPADDIDSPIEAGARAIVTRE
jgi:hypothetical protein